MPPTDEKLLPPPEEHPLIEAPADERLQKEIDALRREVEELRAKDRKKKEQHEPVRPQKRTLWWLAAGILAVLLLAFFIGWMPHHRREEKIRKEANQEAHALPEVNFVEAQNSASVEELMLPGTTEALLDAPVLARATGYVQRMLVDIGDRVKKGQLLAVLAAPDLDQQVVQAQAQLLQSEAALKQAGASLVQGRANENLARVTAIRYQNLVQRGAIARQDYDNQEANYQAQVASVEALNQAVAAANQNVESAKANLQRLEELRGFEQVRAPFDGVVTLRNTDMGALISTGSTLLFRVAQIDRLRTYINVPQPNAPSVKVSQEAQLISPEFGSRQVIGRVTRTAEALDPSTRTLLTEVQIDNTKHELRPGMFVQVNLKNNRTNPPILIPGDSIISSAKGTQVAVIRDAHSIQIEPHEEDAKSKGSDEKKGGKQTQQQKPKQGVEGTIHLQEVKVGRDYGAATEVYSGLNPGDRVIVNPNDQVRDNVRVRGIETKASLDVVSGGPGAAQPNASSEKLAPEPSGEKQSKQPSKMRKNRGPGY